MAVNHSPSGVLFDFQGFSVHDGPGCRSVVFMKGCSLRCQWCANPEGISSAQIPLYTISQCLLEGDCLAACTSKAIQLQSDRIVIDTTLCASCTSQQCIQACPTKALKLSGYQQTIDQLYSKIQRDSNFWGDNGGVTLSGGEPLLQIDFTSALLKKCYDACIHTALETCGQIPWSHFEAVLPHLDWIFFDLKHIHRSLHKVGTGSDNQRILENARQLGYAFQGRLIFRLPLIPGFNDAPAHLHDMAEFIRSTGRNEINLLPLHHWGREKYAKLQLHYRADQYTVPTEKQLQEAQAIFNAHQLKCYIGSETPF